MGRKTDKQNIFWYFFLVIVIIIIAFVHLYKLTEIPYGLNVDEAGAAYDAYSIATYGVDRYIKSYPVYFINYGDGQNALYTYLTAVLFRLFGASKLMVRTSIALSAFLAALFGFLYASGKWKEKGVSYLFLCLYAVLPIFTMTQRFGLESHLMLSASILVLYTTVKALETEKCQYYLISGIVLGLSLYTYALIYIVLPVYLLLWLVYGIYLKKIHIRKLLLLLLPLALLAAPLIMVQLINAFSLPELQIGPITFTRLPEYRSGELGIHDIFRNLKQMFVNTLLYDNLPYNTVAGYGTMYYFSLPFIFIGFGKTVKETYLSFRKRQLDYSALILFWFTGEFIMGCLLQGWSTPNTTRMIGIFMVYLYFLANGIYSVWKILKRVWQKRAFSGILAGLYAISFVSFAHYYFTDYNQEAFPMNWLFYEPYDEVSAFLEEHGEESWASRATCYPWNYVYYLWSYKINPYDISLSVNGAETFGQDRINEFPANTLVNHNYVVYYTDQGSISFLTQLGYHPVSLGSFTYFISPLESYEQLTETGDLFYVDSLQAVENGISFSGWCMDEKTDAPYMGYLLEIDDVAVEILRTERQDVADAYGREDYLECGFTATLPMDTFQTSESFTLIGIREDGSLETVYQLIRKKESHKQSLCDAGV